MLDWLSLLVGIVLAALRGRQALVVENLLLRQQLAVALRTRRRPRVRWHDRLFWVVARRLVTDWRRHLVLVRPETVLRWHRQGWRLFWWWRSRRPTGRPRLPQEVRDLIRRLSEENRLWGTERIRGELLKLGIAVGNGSIRRYRWRPAPRPPSQTWGTFLRNHAHAIWAADLLTVQTAHLPHALRALLHHPRPPGTGPRGGDGAPDRGLGVAAAHRGDALGPPARRTSSGIATASTAATSSARAKALGIQTLLTPFRAPKANAIAERVVRDPPQRVPRPRAHPQRAAPAQSSSPSTWRTTTPTGRTAAWRWSRRSPPPAVPRASAGAISSRPVLGGLHHVYHRAA